MGSESHNIHILFFPLMAQGHILPTIDMVRLLAQRGVKTTIISTPLNVPLFTKALGNSQTSLSVVQFPAKEAGLPEGVENLDLVNSQEDNRRFLRAISMLEQPLDDLLRELRPDGLVADVFFPWATDVASKYGVPRLVFHGTSFFSMCAIDSIMRHQPYKNASSETEPFVLPELPDKIQMMRSNIPEYTLLGIQNDFTKMLGRAKAAEERSHGIIVNSFYELEPAYADHYRNVLGKKAWHIGPVSLCNKSTEEKANRGKTASIDGHYCLKWLDSKKPNSVVYVCFGTTSNFSASQLREIAMGLEASGQEFIWVVRKKKNEENEKEDWVPEGYEKRMEGKGLIIRGWAPQVLILDHESVGGFVTHCGWNSALEGISAGLPMVTWPIFADQFYNEKLITDVLKIGVGVGALKWVRSVGDYVKMEQIEKAVKKLMVGEKAEEMRSRAKTLGEMAKSAVEEGGTSYSDLSGLIELFKRSSQMQKQE